MPGVLADAGTGQRLVGRGARPVARDWRLDVEQVRIGQVGHEAVERVVGDADG
ncbi:hypothetical protein [Frankia nepalensis]|uniref:Uncharacterized protein n=1 Tax=Frankia nepalensis TaxID=1836974 RepID=A0A937RBZ0_9ACTN|nr:hypothetical protein [Frankia nepalensis]MBL7498780.1 hypothetical protein [Frankia nepalensis]MBL7508356.1 hypothetical protein [Frankia nepalensis]MBL7626185.1 hypothetical protein [Frankia nepalensis]